MHLLLLKKILVGGVTYFSVKNHKIMHSASKADIVRDHSLIDLGENRGVAGEDVCTRFTHLDLRVDIRGMCNHEINSVPIATAVGVNSTTIGELIITMHEHAYYSKENTIHSSGQVGYFKNFVDDKSIKVGCKKHILTNDNYMIPVAIKNGLSCMPLHPCTDQEWLTLRHVALTPDVD